MRRRLAWTVREVVPPVGLFVLVVVAWQLATTMFAIPRYLLPGPKLVFDAAVAQRHTLLTAMWLTASGALCAFALSLLFGTLIAFGFSQSRIIRNSGYPYAIFLQTVPIIAIAPLVITWFGYGYRSVVIVAFIISVFPIITNATTGLISVDPDLLSLFRLHNASRWQTLWKLRLPNAIPHLVTGAKISSGASVIGAIVGEYFASFGPNRFGLGYLILQASPQMKTDELFAAVFASTLLGVAVFGSVSLIGATILARWYDLPADQRR